MRTVKEDDLLRGIKAELGFELSEESVVLLDRVDVLMDDLEICLAESQISM